MTSRRIAGRTLIASFGLLLCSALFAVLGVWQLRRAEASRDLIERFAVMDATEPRHELPAALADSERFQRVSVRGSYAEEPQFLLDNRLHEGIAGYEVLTALELDGGGPWLLVNRGWVAADLDRRVLPSVAVAAGTRRVTGRLERLPRAGLRLGPGAPAEPVTGVAVVQYPTAAELATALDRPLRDYELLLDPGEPDGYLRDWRAPGLTPDRHLSYAGQWLLLSVGALAAAVTILIKSRKRSS